MTESVNQDHPDLVEIDRHIRHHLERVLRAEQDAANLNRRRRASLRDRLIDLEERSDPVIISRAGTEITGVVDSVGVDHLDLVSASGSVIIPIGSIDGIRLL